MADKDTNKRRTFDKVESILSESPKGKYRIPDELSMSREVVAEQLKIIAQLYPELESCPPAKQSKKDNTPTAVGKVKTATPPKPAKMASSPPKTKSPATPSGAPSKGNAVADLFAERRARMAKQQQEQKKAEAPPSATPSSSSQPPKPTPQTGLSLKKVIPRNIHDYYPVVAPKGKMAAKLAAAAPYNMFFTTITDAPVTHREPLSVTFQELLDPSLGELECSVQMNFMVDIGWLLGHYFFAGYEDRPLLILYGDESPELKTVSTKKPNVTALKVHIATPFGVHHTKMGLYGYTDGSMRVVISTANLYEDDFHNRTQGLWISPRLPALAEDADTGAGESRTGFRESLITYLNSYKFAQLAAWVSRIQRTDFGEVNVFFVASIPGGHLNTAKGPLWGHPRLGYLLGKHSAPIDDACPLVAQSSSIGSLGPNPQSWVLSEIMASFRRDSAPVGLRRVPSFRMIFPSFSNVRNSHDNLLGGGCLPYMRATHEKQPWLKDHLHQWKSDCRNRTKAVPHIKTYCRWSHRGLYWFLLTSANLSKAAWGVYNKSAKFEAPLRINSYEVGVLFLPKFVIDENFFPMESKSSGDNKHPAFPMPYDVPIIPYAPEDSPFFMDYLRG
ncbi:tyrosyl-dna phosphodiesterase [Culex quinquefasciatus]|uniref:Tyrosyl-dna phosphodiesterase n=1 Tax=Culex quinquefasciatus TaxID=7176 RepID=B0WGW2_CULQU|nr:tyrosyl-dna phosphodiesterase [Culex quinquefasciatus]|eukprot:XP_001847946.1 tyrosyl-dna phosphodiesterase [Culex quinquefasciatus]